MKTLLFILLLPLALGAANPSYQSFDTNQFSSNSLHLALRKGNVPIASWQVPILTNAFFDGPILNNWAWVIDENFLGDAATSARIGREAWATSLVGGGALPQKGSEVGAIGIEEFLVTNNTDRASIIVNSGGGNSICVTSTPMFFICRVRASSTNTTSDGCNFQIGISSAATTNPPTGVFFRYTNDIWEGIIANQDGAYSTNSSGSLNRVTNDWQTLAWSYDGAQTVIYYIGNSETALTPFATNTGTNIPSITRRVTPLISLTKTMGTSARMTNDVDYFRLAVKLY